MKGDFTPGKTVYVGFNTHKADGTPITLAGTPAVSVYKKGSTTESTTGVTLTVDYDSRTGYQYVAIDTSADGTFYAAGNDFDVVITTGTVDSISVVGTLVGQFSLSNRSALRPATADRTIAVDASGNAPATIAAGAIATDALTAAALKSDAVAEIQSGLMTAADSNVAAIKAKTDNLPSDPADASDIAAAFSTVNSTLTTIASYIDTEVAAIKAKTDNLPSDPADASDIAASFSSIATTLSTIAGYIDTEVAAIKAKTDNLPAAPAAVGDIPTANQNADALLKRDWTSVTGEAARSVLNALRFLRNKWSISGSTLTVTKEDDSTTAFTASVSSDAAADPITGSDPS